MIEKNQERISVVAAVGAGGEGIVKEEGCVIFLPFVFSGEKVRYKILKVKKNVAFGKVLEVLAPARERVRPVCPLFTKCGGCRLQHLAYPDQLELKRAAAADCFHKIAGLDLEIPPAVPAERQYGYRNKLQIPVVWQNGETVIGFYAENSHRAVKTERCAIQPGWAERVIAVFNEYIKTFGIKGYDEQSHSGELRHIVARGVDGKYIVTAVALSEKLPHTEFLIEKLKTALGEFSFYINVNDKRTNVVFGERFSLVYGPGKYTVGEKLRYEFGPQSFLQVNREMSEKLYKKAVELAAPSENGAVIDAFSGAGLMTAMLAMRAKAAYGVEIVPEAVRCADALAKNNKLGGKMFNLCGKCEEILPELVPKLKREYGEVSVVLDPPRKGAEESVLAALEKAEIENIVYISCNPATLARDVGLLVGSLVKKDGMIVKAENFTPKYEITYIRPYDFFPHTRHIETLVCLKRKG